MRKLLVAGIVVIMIGVVIAGSGSVTVFEPKSIMEGRQSGIISYSMAGNASFLAPIPINYTLNQIYSPVYHRDYVATPRIIAAD